MNNRKIVILLGVLTLSAGILLFPSNGFTQEKKTVDGMVQIERNHLYMISVGSEDGVSKGDPIEIYRIGVKVALARTISVLPDSSMIEILGFINVTTVYESDTVHYISSAAAIPTVLPTLSSEGRRGNITVTASGTSGSSSQLDKLGLLGSSTSINRNVYLAKQPLQKEIDSLKAGIKTLEEDYEGKMGVVLDTVKGGASRAALKVERKWKKKLSESEEKYRTQLTSQRKALEDEFSGEKRKFEEQIEALTLQISDAGEVGDRRTQQLMSDLESTDVKINLLRDSYERERTFDKDRWSEKVSALEEEYQNQLRNQQNEFKRELLYSNGKYQDEIAFLNRQINELRDKSKREVESVRKQLNNEQSIVKSLRSEKDELKADIGDKNKQLVKSKKGALEAGDALSSEKAAHVEKIKAFKLPYERQIKELKEEIVAIKQSHKEELGSAQLEAKETLLTAQEEQEDQFSLAQGKYQFDITQMKKTSKEKANFLQVQLNDRQAVINELEKDNAKLNSELRQNEKHIEQLSFNIETLMGDHKDFKAKRDRDVESANKSIKEDKSLIKFLNSEMAELTDDIENKDKKINRLDKELAQLEENSSKAKLKNQANTHKLVRDYESKVKTNKKTAADKLSSAEQKWQNDLIAQEKAYGKKIDVQKKDLEEKISNLGKQIVALQGDSDDAINGLQGQLGEKNSKAKSLESEISELIASLQAKTEYGKELEGSSAQLNDDMAKSKVFHSKEISELGKQIMALRGDSDSAISKLKDQLKERDSFIKSLENQNAGLDSNLKKEIKKGNKLEDSIAQLRESKSESKKSHSKEISQLGDQIAALRGDSDSAISKLQSQLDEKSSNVKQLNDEISELNSNLKKKIGQSDKMEDTIAQLNENMAKAKKSHSKEISQLGDQIAVLRGDSDSAINKLQDRLDDKNSEVKLLNVEIVGLNSDFKKKGEQANKLEDKVAQLNEHVANAKLAHADKIASLNEQISDLRGDSNSTVSKLQSQLDERNSYVKSLESKNDGLTAGLQMKIDQARNLEDNVAQVNENIAKLKLSHSNENSSLGDQISALRGDSDSAIAQLQDQLDERKDLIKSLEAANDQLKSEVDRRDIKIAKLDDQITGLNINLEETKVIHSEKVKHLKRPLEAKFKKAESELKLAKKIHENQIKEMKSNAKDDIAIAQDRFRTKLALKDEESQRILEIQKQDYQEKIDELGFQVTALKGDSKGVIRRLEEKLDEKRTMISSLERKNVELKSDLRVKDEVLVKSDDKIDVLSRKVKNLQGDSDGDMRGLRSELEAKEALVSSLEDTNRQLGSDLENKELQLSKFGDNIVQLTENIRETELSHTQKMKFEKMTLEEKIRELNFDLEMVKKNHANQLEALHERKLLEESVTYDKRIALAKESLEAEIKMLKSELAFSRENHDDKTSFLAEKSANDLRVAQQKHQAQMNANDARWKMKLATVEEEYRQQLSSGTEILKSRLSNNRGELRETIEALNERFGMLKNSSDNQIKELESELAAKQYNTTLRESEFQKRFTDSEERWAAKLAEIQKRNQELLMQQKKVTSQEFLKDKKELRTTVIDLTGQMRGMRETSVKRIKELEDKLERKDYKLNLVEDTTQQNTFDIEEKWRAKLIALEEKYQRELIHQRRDIEQQVWSGREKQQTQVSDLSSKLNSLQGQHNLDLALKEEERAAELALLKGKYEQEISNLKSMSSAENNELSEKVRYQQNLIDNLERQKSDLEFGILQKERSLSHTESTTGNLKKEMRMLELSQSEKLRLSQESARAKIADLSAQLAIARDKALTERIELEDRWKEKFRRTEENYYAKLKIQQESLEGEIDETNLRLKLSNQSKTGEVDEIRDELEDSQTLVHLLSREKDDLTRDVEIKDREIVSLNEEIIRLKEGIDDYREMSGAGPLGSDSIMSTERIERKVSASKSQTWYGESKSSAAYYAVVRKAILNNFQKFDFSKYAGKEGVVKIDFELFADGSPKGGPDFIGTQDEELKGLLMQCFEGAAPFPPFPKELNKESQRFALSVSFKK